MPVFDQIQQASFAGIPFPVDRVEVRGGLRDHVHEYPHSPGGAPEKLGRKLYEIQMSANFQATFRAYPDLYPKALGRLRKIYEDQTTDDLVIPTIGSIKAYATSWTQNLDAKIRSGERAEFSFREDQSGAYLVDALLTLSVQSLPAQGARFAKEAAKLKPKPSLFDDITNLVNSITGIMDQANAYGLVLAAKLQGLASLCDQADRTLKQLNDPTNRDLLDALHDLWSSAARLRADVIAKGPKLIAFQVTATMSAATIAQSLYGESKRAIEILQLNPIDDAFRVAQGTVLQVYAPG